MQAKMEKKEIIDIFVEGRPITSAGEQPEQDWKNTIKNAFSEVEMEPIDKSVVKLDFALSLERFMRRGRSVKNDLDNLAKPVLDVLVQVGVFTDDSGILDLTLRKRKSKKEGVRIRVSEFSGPDFVVI